MPTPRFSVVIPSRNRPETLPVTLQTVLAQDFDDYEILVVDNASDVDLSSTFAEYNDPRIRYHRQPRPLAMTDNWNDALHRTEGEWVLFLGDDDGLCRSALSTIDRLANEYPVRSMRWNWGKYTWPDLPDTGLRSKLGIPVFGQLRLRDYAEVIAGMIQEHGGADLPFTYHSVVERSLIQEAQVSGPVFAGPIPDLHSGVLYSRFDEQFLDVGEPLTVMGWSGLSTTVAQVTHGATRSAHNEFEEFNVSAGHAVHPQLPDLVTNPFVHWWDPILRVRDRFALSDARMHPDPTFVAQETLNFMWSSGQERIDDLRVLHDFCRRHGVSPDGLVEPHTPWPRPALLPRGGQTGLDGDVLTVDAQAYGVGEVDGACALLARVLEGQDFLRLVYEAGRKSLAECIEEHGRAAAAHDRVVDAHGVTQAENAVLANRVTELEGGFIP